MDHSAGRPTRNGFRASLGLDELGPAENYGTTEEKRFLFYFSTVVERLEQSYSLVRVLRNEGQVAIYEFDTGRRFEPDFLLFLQKTDQATVEQYQVFVEPKGSHLLATHQWKQDFMLRLKAESQAVMTLSEDAQYRVWGLPFYCHEPAETLRKFTDAVDAL